MLEYGSVGLLHGQETAILLPSFTLKALVFSSNTKRDSICFVLLGENQMKASEQSPQ